MAVGLPFRQTVCLPDGCRIIGKEGSLKAKDLFECPYFKKDVDDIPCGVRLPLTDMARHVRKHQVPQRDLLFRRCLKHESKQEYVILTHRKYYPAPGTKQSDCGHEQTNAAEQALTPKAKNTHGLAGPSVSPHIVKKAKGPSVSAPESMSSGPAADLAGLAVSAPGPMSSGPAADWAGLAVSALGPMTMAALKAGHAVQLSPSGNITIMPKPPASDT